MVDIEYANAYSEVLGILKSISIEDYNKIPKEKIQVFKEFSNKEYTFDYDESKTLDEQNVSKRAKAIIAILFRDYWATPSQRERIITKQNKDRQKLEEENRKKYSTEDLFKKKTITQDIDEKQTISSNLPISVEKETFYKKIVNFIKKVLHI